MSRSGYTYDCDDHWAAIRWSGALKSVMRGKRGQAFFQELLDALDALPQKRLIQHELIKEGEVCALGSVALKRGMDMSHVDPEDYDQVAEAFNINEKLAREVEYQNDECGHWNGETPEERFERIRAWVVKQIASSAAKTEKH
jgi:hypothetical protein